VNRLKDTRAGSDNRSFSRTVHLATPETQQDSRFLYKQLVRWINVRFSSDWLVTTITFNIVPQSSICFGFGDTTFTASELSLTPFVPTAMIM
jgi:hypothetical protein